MVKYPKLKGGMKRILSARKFQTKVKTDLGCLRWDGAPILFGLSAPGIMAPGNTLEHEVALGNTRGHRRYDRDPIVITHIRRNVIYSVYLSSSNLASIVGNTSYRRCKNLISKISSHYFLSGTYLILPRTRFIPPRDLKDAYDNWPKWKAIFITQKGLLLLLIGLKFPCLFDFK